MARLPRRPKNAKPTPPRSPATPSPKPARPTRAPTTPSPKPASSAASPRLTPADELEARLREPDEGPFLNGLEKRVIYPTLIERITDAGQRIVEVLTKYDSPDLFLGYESLEFEVAEVRERAAFGLGWEHGSADGRAESFRTQAPGLSERAKRLADQARALVVNGQLTPVEAAALLAETIWAVVLTQPAPAFER
jgi:hypothetical protein